MTELVVRRLLVDLQTPLPRHWLGGDAFRTAFFNALSMSFPVGEQFFIDSVRLGIQALPEPAAALAEGVKAFIGQEATHRRLHELFNTHLAQQGLVNTLAPRALKRLKRLDGVPAAAHVGMTAATEHFTAIMAEYFMSRPDWFAGTEPRLMTLWQWHASEELEHCGVAYDLYIALGGPLKWRRRFFYITTLYFLIDMLRQTVNNLHHDGSLWRRSTWASAWRTILGRDGLMRVLAGPWRHYLRADFHPHQLVSGLGPDWLVANANHWRAVGA